VLLKGCCSETVALSCCPRFLLRFISGLSFGYSLITTIYLTIYSCPSLCASLQVVGIRRFAS
jgi:hypothetical protein